MTAFLLHLLRSVWHARISSFPQIYAAMTVSVVMGLFWVLPPSVAQVNGGDRDAATPDPRNRHLGWAVAASALIAVILIGYVVVAVKWEAFADYDESLLTLTTLSGINFPNPIWIDIGRFFPLGNQEINLIRHFTSTAAGYHIVPIAELSIISCIYLFLDRALSFTARASLTVFLLLSPSIVSSFGGLVFQERNVVFWLAWLLLFVKLFESNGSTGWAVAAAISAQNMIYYKESAFLLLGGFAVGRLTVRWLRTDRRGWDLTLFRTRESRLDLCFIALGLTYFLYYESIMIYRPNTKNYLSLFGVSWNQAIGYYLQFDLLAILFVIVVVTRAYLIIRRKVEPAPFWDGLAVGGALCYAAYIEMRLCYSYYLAPVDFIAVLYVGRFMILSWDKPHSWNKAAVSALAVAVLLQNLSLSAFRVYERENLLQAKVRMADAIAAVSDSNSGQVQRLFFPFSSKYTLTEFASYLLYRGFDVEGYEAYSKSTPLRRLIFVSPAFAEDGRCVDYREFVCHAGRQPSEGDLVIELPDDLESAAEMNPYKSGGRQLFAYQPRPHLHPWMLPELNYLRIASYQWRFTELPDRWLNSSVTLKNQVSWVAL